MIDTSTLKNFEEAAKLLEKIDKERHEIAQWIWNNCEHNIDTLCIVTEHALYGSGLWELAIDELPPEENLP